MQLAVSKIFVERIFYYGGSEPNESKPIVQVTRVSKTWSKKSNKTFFQDLIVCNLGVKPKEHYPKIKNLDGSSKKDSEGQDVRAKEPDGWIYTFAEFGTCTKVIAIISKSVDLELMAAYKLSGLGYAMRSSNMIFVDEQVLLSNY